MTKEILTFNSREEANIEKKNRVGIWRSLHTDFINKKYVITFVNGDDDPNNSEEQEQINLEFQRLKELTIKLKNRTISPIEQMELFETVLGL